MGSTANFHRRLGSTLFFFLTLFSYKIGCTVLGFPTFSPVKLTYSANSIPLLCLIFQMPQPVSFWVLFFWQYIPIFLLQKLNDIHSLADLTHDFFKHIIPSLPSTFLLSDCHSNPFGLLEYISFVHFHIFPLVKYFVSQKMIR